MANSTSATTCADCQAPLGRRWTHPIDKNRHPCGNTDCHAQLCTACFGRHPLLLPKPSTEKKEHLHGIPYSDCEMKQLCRACFHEKSTLDFSTTFHRVGNVNSSKVTFIMVHGGSGSRQMFHQHALEWQENFDHASILLDLPGHGANVEMPLTIDNCVKQLGQVLTECGLIEVKKDGEKEVYTKANADHKLVYLGGSLGAYIGFHVVDVYKSILDGAVMMDCGQNVGPGCSFKARAGLVMLRWLGKHMTNAKLMGLMLGETKKSPADYYLVETSFGSCMFFDQATAQVDCLHSVAPAQCIPNYPFPVLFMNGSEDYRDSESKWLALCKNQQDSELKVYEGGDHFSLLIRDLCPISLRG